MRNKGEPPVQVLTIGGEIELNRRYFWSKSGGGVYPVDTLIGIFYDQSKTREHVFATEGHHERFGELLRLHADALRLERAIETLSLTDGGLWIRNQLLKRLKKLKAIPSRLRTRLLDFYHLSEHVWDTAKVCWGDGEEARAWARQQLHDIKHLGGLPLLAAIVEAKKKLRAPGQTRCPGLVAELHRGTLGDGGVPGGVGQWLGHRLRSDRGHVQEPHSAAQASGHEMGHG